MGCDIHMYVEKLIEYNGEMQWVAADRFKYDHENSDYYVDELLSDRNYTLFSALAGVRSGGNEVQLLSEPKGLPDDCCDYIKMRHEEWESDLHSCSYCTLQELYDYQDKYSGKVKYSGLVSPQDAIKIDNGTGTPSIWCAATYDETWLYREWEVNVNVMGELVQKLEERARKEFLIYNNGRIGKEKAEQIRIVFWFDN